MVEDNSIRETAAEPQSDTAAGMSEEASDTPKRTSVWRGVVRVIGEVAVNLLVGGLPFFVAGVFWLSDDDLSSRTAEWSWAPWAIILIGAAIVVVGFIVSLISRPRLDLLPSERVLGMRHPSIKPPLARMVIGVLLFAAAGYMLWFTLVPYIYPVVSFMVGMYLYLRGLTTYWMNHHTAYYATNYRVVRMYSFHWWEAPEIAIDSADAIAPTRSFFELLTGRGNVRVVSGIGKFQRVHMKEIDDPRAMTRAIQERRYLPNHPSK